MKLVLLRISLFCYILLFCLFANNAFSQCTLTIDSTVSTNVTCNGDSNGTITVYTSGGKGTVSYNNGASGGTLVSQPFNTNVIDESYNENYSDWWVYPPGGCSNQSATPYYPIFQWSSTMGCPGGAIYYQGDANWGYEGCLINSPEVNMSGLDSVQLTFNLTNNASGASDNLQVTAVSVNGSVYVTGSGITINGQAGNSIYFGSARSCALMTVVINLTSIPTNERNAVLIQFDSYSENPSNSSDYLAVIDNVNVGSVSTGQASNEFTGLKAGIYTITVTDTAGCIATITDTITQPNALTATASSTSPTTVGGTNGTATAIVSGGTKPYTYTWSTSPVQHTDTATGLSPGDYTVTITDHNNCTTIASTTVTAHSCTGFTFSSVNGTAVACYGGSTGSIAAVATGGTSPYEYALNYNGTYQASGDFTGLSSRIDTVKAEDAAGCTTTSILTITQPASALRVVVDTFGATSAGNNGKIIAVASGGTTPYQFSINGTTYQVSDSFENLAGGKTYCITVEDSHNCIDTACGFVSQSSCPTITINTSTDSVECFGGNTGSITIKASGGASPYQYSLNGGTYQASDSFTGLNANSYAVSVKDANGCTGSSSVTVYEPSALGINAVGDSVLCNGGSTGAITIIASGGTPPYQYSFNSGAFQPGNVYDGLTANLYNVGIKDSKGCILTSTVTVAQPPVLTVSVGTESTSTIGGSDGKAYALVSGGTSPYSYVWNNIPTGTADSITGLTAGNYCVTVTDLNNCTVSNCGTVSQPNCSGFSISDSVVNDSSSVSSDGAIYITFNGATLPITFKWSNGDSTQDISGLPIGYYCVIATDAHGCSANLCDSVKNNITSCYGLKIDSVVVTNAPCPYVNGGVIVVYTKGGLGTIQYSIDTGTTFVLSNTFNNLAAGPYKIEAEDTNGCLVLYASNPVTVTQPQPDTVNITQTGDTLTAAYFSNATYTWYWNNTPAPGVDTLRTYILDTVSGDYRVQVLDSVGCNLPSIVISYTYDGITSINGQTDGLVIYPNPFSEVLNVTFNSAGSNTIQVELFDVLGNKLYEDKPAGNSFTIPTTGLAQGMYLIRLELNGQFIYRQAVKD